MKVLNADGTVAECLKEEDFYQSRGCDEGLFL